MGQTDSKPHWQPDDAARDCAGCKEPFTVSRRRHHCRSCGLVFCDPCTKHRAHDPAHMPRGTSDRVCQPCYDALTGTVSNRASPSSKVGAGGGAAGGANGTSNSARGGGGADGAAGPGVGGGPPRRPVVVVAEENSGPMDDIPGPNDPNGNDGGDDGEDDEGAQGSSTALFENAMNRANALLVDVRALCTSRPPGPSLRMTNRNIEADLKVVGGTTHLDLPPNADPAPVWSPHALANMDVSSTLFAVHRELPQAIFDAHVAAAEGAGITLNASLTMGTIGVRTPQIVTSVPELATTAVDT